MKKTTRKHNTTPAAVTVKREVKPATTSEEAAMIERIMAESKGWGDITEKDVDDFMLANNPMEIPEPAKEKERKREFKHFWRSRTKERQDEIRNMPPLLRLGICNSTTTPYLKGYFDPLLGCVCKLDQMLMYMPWNIWEMRQKYKDKLAAGADAAGSLEKKDGAEIQKGAKFVAGQAIGSKDTIVADETVDPRIDNFEEAPNFEQDAQAV